jgi:hypothetical protein
MAIDFLVTPRTAVPPPGMQGDGTVKQRNTFC